MASKKKKTTTKGRGAAARPKKAAKKTAKKKTAKKAGKKAHGKKTGKKRARKGKQTVTPPHVSALAQLRAAPYGWGRVPQSVRDAAQARWKLKPATSGTVVQLPALPAGSSDESHPLVRAYARAGGTPPGYVRSGPWVGPSKPWPKKGNPSVKKAGKKKHSSKKPSLSKEEFLKRMEEGRAAAKKGKTGKKKASKKAKKKHHAAKKTHHAAKKTHAAKTSPARAHAAKKRAHSPSASKKRRSSKRTGWPMVGRHKRTFGIAKFQAMNKMGVPPNHPRARAKRAELREAAGRTITAKDVFNMVEGTGMKAWVCSGMRRTGCGGGSKMLRGSHQIGVFAVPRALQR